MPKAPVKITMNVGNPELAFEFRRLPNEGVGLARLEFIIARMIGVHPKAVLAYPDLPPTSSWRSSSTRRLRRPGDVLRREAGRGRGHAGRGVLAQAGDRAAVGFQVQRVFEPRPAARKYEPHEENPMLGFRGASRYIAAIASATASNSNAARMKQGARRNGADQRRDHGAVRAHRGRGASKVLDLLARQRPEARRRTACASS